ncbi:probable caffeine synthase 2 [Pistacia vera]|uniref:probable caffeine synthase 2 n=1 Tax=Pistacia vera TaxID=55513 RepID=UPI001262DD15|nr:probable caffeine synthase 2 [Pistacia vera]
MEVKNMLFMSKGNGESSFFQNCSFTQKVVAMSKPALEKVVESLFSEGFLPYQVMNVADLGCSSGRTTFLVMETVIESVKRKCRELNYQIPEFQFYLNDLPGNDFNTLFKGLSNFTEKYNDLPCFVMGCPGSFHGRLFPKSSMHLVHSSYGAHWLSKVPRLMDKEGLPLNKGKVYISKTSPAAVKEEYLAQFQEDFSLFLKSRSHEMIREGRVILIINGRLSEDPTNGEPWEPLAEAIADMVSLEVIPEEKLDSFNVPYYIPSEKEVKNIVDREGSFELEVLETFPIEMGDKSVWSSDEKFIKNLRSFTESMVSHHFGEEILDKLYDKFAQIVLQDLATRTEPSEVISFVVVLRRL